jgi:hypothetical protein
VADGTSGEHEQAPARGRRHAKAVRDYLDALGRERRPRGQLTEEELRRQVEELRARIEAEPNAAKRVELIQKRLDAEERLETVEDEFDMEELERGFIEVAAPYSHRKGITYTAWREAGVPARVLREAGVRRTRRSG